jgi:hypothetical protein
VELARIKLKFRFVAAIAARFCDDRSGIMWPCLVACSGYRYHGAVRRDKLATQLSDMMSE